jgi:phage protein D
MTPAQVIAIYSAEVSRLQAEGDETVELNAWRGTRTKVQEAIQAEQPGINDADAWSAADLAVAGAGITTTGIGISGLSSATSGAQGNVQ